MTKLMEQVRNGTPEYMGGYMHGLRDAIRFLHRRADETEDHHAEQVLHSAAFALGVVKRDARVSQRQEW